MINLIRNENMKIYRRARTWILIALQIVAIFVPLFFVQFNNDTDWRAAIVEENNMYAMELSESEQFLNEEDIQEINSRIEINNYRLEHNIAPESSLWNVVMEWSFLLQIGTFFIVIIASDAVASEFSWGTAKLLLIRPVSRIKILISKYIAMLLFAAIIFLLNFICPMLIGAFAHGFDGFTAMNLVMKDGAVQESYVVLDVLRIYLSEAIGTLMIVTLAFMLSTVFRSSSLSITMAILLLMFGKSITMLLGKYEWAKFILFANIDLTPYFNGGAPLPGMTLGFSIIMLCVYFIVFHVISCGVFAKRDIA